MNSKILDTIRKKIMRIYSSNIWIHFAILLSVVCTVYVVADQVLDFYYIRKLIVLSCIGMDILLLIRYQLWKNNYIKLLLAIVLWMIISGFAAGGDIHSIFHGSVIGNWYICILVSMISMVIDHKRKERWLHILINIMLFMLSVLFVLFLYNATKSLLDPSIPKSSIWGMIKLGRLHAIGNANPIGAAVVTYLLGTLWMTVYTFRAKKRAFYPILLVYFLLGITILSLSRSRGGIIGLACAIATIVFIRLWQKKHRNTLSKIALSFLGALLVASIVIFSAFIPKFIYDKSTITLSQHKATVSEENNIVEKLTPYSLTYALDTLTDRTLIWPAVFRIMDEKPSRWIVGESASLIEHISVYDIYVNRPDLSAPHCHNGYLNQLLLNGLPGLLLSFTLLAVWIIRSLGYLNFVNNETLLTAKLPICFIIAPCVVGIVEMYPFPWKLLYIPTYFCFVAAGCVCEAKEINMKKNRKRIIFGITAIIILANGFISIKFMNARNRDKAFIESYVPMQAEENEFISLNHGVLSEMMQPAYWYTLTEESEETSVSPLMSEAEIQLFNHKNRKMIQIGDLQIALEDIGDKFNLTPLTSLIYSCYLIPQDVENYLLNGMPTTAEYWQGLVKNLNIDGIPRAADTRFGYSILRTNLKKLPTNDAVYQKDDNLYYDFMLQSDLPPVMPVVVLHESLDGEWYFILTYGYGGWVQKKAIALCENKQDWLNRQTPDNFLVVTGKELRVSTDPYHEELSNLLLPMGTKLELVPLAEIEGEIHDRSTYGNYVVKMPVRIDNGTIDDKLVLIPITADVNMGYLPYTEKNVIELAFKHLGSEYGWAGANNALDCSGLTRAIFSCFGFQLPRTAGAQTQVENLDIHNVVDMNVADKISFLENAPAGTMLFFPGHIMIYLGNVDGIPYCISSVGSFATKDMEVGTYKSVNSVVITNMIDTTRKSGASWLECIEKIVIPIYK